MTTSFKRLLSFFVDFASLHDSFVFVSVSLSDVNIIPRNPIAIIKPNLPNLRKCFNIKSYGNSFSESDPNLKRDFLLIFFFY